MTEADPRRPAFTLRFRNEATHRTLRLTAHALGVSMNELAETAIEHELAFLGTDLEQKLTRTAEYLRAYRGTGVDKDIEAFAHAEVTVDDPLQSRQATLEDTCGIGALFARSLER
jgi:hypothetical protein